MFSHKYKPNQQDYSTTGPVIANAEVDDNDDNFNDDDNSNGEDNCNNSAVDIDL